jgi:murein tripeptide amidase MpaA
MERISSENPNITMLQSIGRSSEGRDIVGMRIADAAHLAEETLPVILVTAGASGRDWISVMSAVHVMHQLVEHYHMFNVLVDEIEWIILPVCY